MEIKVKPIIVLGRREGWFCRSDGSVEFVADGEAVALKVAELSKELREKLQSRSALLEDTIVRNENDLAELKRDSLKADALLVYLIGVMPVQSLFQWGLPIVAFSGQHRPMLALYAFGVERHSRAGITIALDFQDIDEEIRLLDARKKLQKTRIALFGFPPPIFSRWHHLPDLELAREKLGVEFSPVEINAARLFLAMSDILAHRKANAMAINCVELTALELPPPCYAMTRLRDEGIHAACEADVSALLTMMMLGYVADGPAFMGNIVGANPQSNVLMISHCVVPTRMAGFSQPPRPYTLRNYHGGHGVTAHVELDMGQEVTIARLARNMDKIMLLRGELVDCRDTTTCRTTISARVNDVRSFVRCALGNHHAVVYGNHVGEIKALSDALGISAVEL
jgi:L-fucose isomerase-like protein